MLAADAGGGHPPGFLTLSACERSAVLRTLRTSAFEDVFKKEGASHGESLFCTGGGSGAREGRKGAREVRAGKVADASRI